MKKIISLALAWALFALLTTGAAWSREVAEEPFEQTVSVSPNGLVTLTNTNGAVHVEGWSGTNVEITATKKARANDDADARRILDDIRIEVTDSGGNVVIDTDLPKMKGWRGGSASVEFHLKVPAGVDLKLRSTNGKIEVAGVNGMADLTTVNGGIKANNLGGALIAETTNGKVEATNIDGPIDAETTNGGIRAEITASSLNDDIELSTTNGSVDLTLAGGVGARIDAKTDNGSVKSDLPLAAGRQKRNSLSGDLNGGGKTIRIRTSNGSVRIREN